MVLVCAGLVFSVFSKELIILLAKNSEYWIAYTVVPVVAFAFVIKGIQYTFALSFHYTKKTIYSAVVFILGAVINFSLNILLVPKYNFPGAAISLLVAIIIMMLLSYILGQRVYRIPYEIMKINTMLFMGLFLYVLSLFFNGADFWTAIFIKALLIVLFPVSLYIFKVFDDIEVESFKNGVKDFLNLFRK